jgi:hypothetical protein
MTRKGSEVDPYSREILSPVIMIGTVKQERSTQQKDTGGDGTYAEE